MKSLDYSLIITILYISIYGMVFLITSIVCAVKVKQLRQNKKNTYGGKQNKIEENDDDNGNKTLQNIYTKEATMDDDDKKDPNQQNNNIIDIEDKTDNKSNDKWYTPIKEWFNLVKEKRKVYLSLIPHIFDQATDYGVIYSYYKLWQETKDKPDEEIGAANPLYFFIASIFVIILHRLISTAAIFQLTRKWSDVFLQCFDLLMIRAIWVNYKMDKREKSNPQRFLEILEATFESAPQLLISTGFILKTSTDPGSEFAVEPIIIVSVLFSLWSLTSRIANDDKTMYVADDGADSVKWRDLDFKCNKCPCMNWRYLFRVIVWRLFEITNRVFLCLLIWINLGGLSLCIILGFELLWCAVLMFRLKIADPLGLIMFFSVHNSHDRMILFFFVYRVVSLFIYLILVTIFAMLKFEASKVEEYSIRHEITKNSNIGLFMLIYTWITSCIWPFACCISTMTSFDTPIPRDLNALLVHGHTEDAMELIEFGVVMHGDGDYIKRFSAQFGSSHDETKKYINTNVLELIHIIAVKNYWYSLSVLEPTEMNKYYDHVFTPFVREHQLGGNVMYMAVAMTSITDITRKLYICCINGNKVLQEIIDKDNIDINAINNRNETVLHRIVSNSPLSDMDMENVKILLNHGIDINIQNNKGETALDILDHRKQWECIYPSDKLELVQKTVGDIINPYIQSQKNLRDKQAQKREEQCNEDKITFIKNRSIIMELLQN